MTEKRFEIDMGRECLKDNEKELSTIYFSDSVDFYELCEVLNSLYEENIEYKQELDNIYLLIGRGDWSGLVDLLTDDEKSKTE